MVEKANDIRPGQVLEYNNKLYLVVSIMHTQPGKGVAYMQVEMKNIKTGTKHYERFRSDANIRRAILNEEDYTYLFSSGNMITLMGRKNYEQIVICKDLLGNKKVYLQSDMSIKVLIYSGIIVSAHVPNYVTLTVKETEKVIRGQTVSSSYKPAILENGLRVLVPSFIKAKDKVVIHTPDDSYYERAK